MTKKDIHIDEVKGVVNAESGSVINQTFNLIYKIPKSFRWLLGIGIFSILLYNNITMFQNNEIIKSNTKQEVTLQTMNEKLDALMIYGDKEKFLKAYFGNDWKQVLKNPHPFDEIFNLKGGKIWLQRKKKIN